MLRDPAPGVVGGDVELQRGSADLVGHRGQRITGRRDVDGDHRRAVAREGPRDGRADAPSRAGHDDHPTVERTIRQRVLRLGGPDPPRLAVHEGRAALQQEGQRRGEVLGRRAPAHEHQVGGGTAAQLLRDRAVDAVDALRGGLGLQPLDGGRVRRDDDHAAGALELPHDRAEHLPDPLQFDDMPDAGGVDDDRAGPRRVGRRHVAAPLVLRPRVRHVDQRRGGIDPQQRERLPGKAPAVEFAQHDRSARTHAPPPQPRRVGEPGLPGDELARGGAVDGLEDAHVTPPPGWRRRPGRPPRRWRSARATPARAPPAPSPTRRRSGRRSPRTDAPRRAKTRRR